MTQHTHCEYLVDGVRVPSVTTVLGRFREIGGLLHWGWNLGMQGKDYRAERDAAADCGTCAHSMVECKIRGKKFDPSLYPKEILDPALVAFGAFERWAKQSHLKPVKTELALVSQQYKFGGTIDAVALGKNDLRLLDWKTSNSTYPEHLTQLAAYGILWKENFPKKPIKGYELVRFSKAEGDFNHYSFTDLTKEEEMFLLLRKAYELDSAIKKRVR